MNDSDSSAAAIPGGDVLSAAAVFIGTQRLTFSTSQFSLTNVGLVVIAIAVATLLLREYRHLTGTCVATAPEPSPTRLAEARG